MQRNGTKRVPLGAKQYAELGLAEPRRVCQHGLEHRLQLAGRTADDAEHLRSRGLLLKRLAQLVEQARVLDGDDGLRREVLDQLDLLVGKRPDFRAVDYDRSD